MGTAKRLALIFVVLVSCVGCDQTTKSIAQSYLPSTAAWSFLGDTVRLQLAHNTGAFLGLGDAMLAKHLHAVGVFAIALYFAGGVSNVIDRWAYGGYVIDFINLGIGPVRTGIFNVADMFIMLGAVILLISELHRKWFPTK